VTVSDTHTRYRNGVANQPGGTAGPVQAAGAGTGAIGPRTVEVEIIRTPENVVSAGCVPP
jgi:hypothetical protein